MDLCNELRSSLVCSKSFNVGHYTQNFEPSFLIPAMLIFTIDFFHFIPLSLTLAGQPAILHDKNFNVGHYTQTLEPFFSYLPCLY